MTSKPIVVICGPSGAGKSTLIKRLIAEEPTMFGFSVSHTTRKCRPGEVDGKDYHFISKEVMQEDIAMGKFVEFAEVHSNFYGTSFQAVNDVVTIQNRRCILDIDVQGVDIVKKSVLHKDSFYIFVSPPSLENLKQRLKKRGTETEESLATRLENAKREMDYRDIANFWDAIVVNDDVDVAYNEFRRAMLKSGEIIDAADECETTKPPRVTTHL